MSQWAVLDQELSRWSAAGRVATLWWRDDDAVAATTALDTLIELSANAGVGLGLAVIPAAARAELVERLAPHPYIEVLQHGYAHVNHEPLGTKACEFGARRGMSVLRSELGAGFERLRELFGARLLPVFVPPWNRIDAGALALLPTLGVQTISTYRPRPSRLACAGLLQVNCHADVMDWRGTRGFIGTRKVLADIVEHLAARREGTLDAEEPTGVLTHHLAHDDDCWTFLRQLFEHTRAHGGARWLGAAEALCPTN